MNLIAIVPAYNESTNIANVVKDITQTIPGVSVVVIDEKGRITHIFPKVKVEGHVDEVLAALTKS